MRATRLDLAALPLRLMRILDEWFDECCPFPMSVDAERNDIVWDETLPPLLLVLMKCAKGSDEMRKYLKDMLLPPQLYVVCYSETSTKGFSEGPR